MGKRLPKYVEKHGPGYRGWYVRDGKRVRLKTRKSPIEAHDDALKARGLAPAKGVVYGATVSNMAVALIESLDATQRRPETIRWYAARLTALEALLGDVCLPLTPEQVEAYSRERLRHVSPNTLGKEAYVLSRLHRLGGYMDPVKAARLPRPIPTLPDIIPQLGVLKYAARIRRGSKHEWEADLPLMLYGFGLRRSDAARCEVSLSGVTIPVSKTYPRSLPLPNSSKALNVVERVVQRGYLVPGDTVERRRETIARSFRRCREEFKLPAHWRPHVLRHSLGAHLARKGVPEYLIATILGHKAQTAGITRWYMQAFGADVKEALGKAWTS